MTGRQSKVLRSALLLPFIAPLFISLLSIQLPSVPPTATIPRLSRRSARLACFRRR